MVKQPQFWRQIEELNVIDAGLKKQKWLIILEPFLKIPVIVHMQQHAFISCIHLYVHMYCWRVFLGLLDERARSHSFYFQPHWVRVCGPSLAASCCSHQQASPEQPSLAQSSSKESKSLSFQTQGAIFESCLKLQLASLEWGICSACAARLAVSIQHTASCLQAIPAQVGHFFRGGGGGIANGVFVPLGWNSYDGHRKTRFMHYNVNMCSWLLA